MQVYGILGLQLTLTAVVAGVIIAVPAAHNLLLTTPALWIGLLIINILSKPELLCLSSACGCA